ncbi:MAG: AAA family ATPase [Bacteroidetes bacterium]|nr:AAA family ATPase [Bacteroidota bacterium]
MSNITNLHSEVYDLLTKKRALDPQLYFTLRKSNRDKRLDQGYWFYGNEWYLAISFWTGMDWKNKTPNIIFVILSESGETYLEINTSDSDQKRKFAVQYLVEPLKLEASGQRYRKTYENENYLSSLNGFLATDKLEIDRIIQDKAGDFFGKEDSKIGFIDKDDFEEQRLKVDKYRVKLGQETSQVYNKYETQKPRKIKEIIIDNYGPIKHIEITNIPFSSQWIFFTGENGTGKTSILRSLATSICSRKITSEEHSSEGTFATRISLYTSESETISYGRNGNNISDEKNILLSGFASYGQSRLKTNHAGLSSKIFKSVSNHELFQSLFNDDAYLIDLQSQFEKWRTNKESLFDFNKRKDYIKEILIDILPNLYDILFNDTIGDIPVTSYIEKDSEDNEFRKVTFNKLASGLKSMIAMIGDILIRLYEQQPNIFDPAEFTGIVLIDEIDIHLHPKLQKILVEQLTKTFPNIQFIVTTHSPIPFLGAPKNSQIFKVERAAKVGVKVKRLDELLILGDLLPNTILTSPIFGLNDIIPSSHNTSSLVRTEINYQDMEFNDLVKKKINEFITDSKEQALIKLFKERRK